MKIQVNKNILWCNAFTSRLAELGVKHVCISPGSRSTSLTLSFAANKNFTVYPIVDERSSAFFALGIAKKTKCPVAIVTTSGTAVAELYPAIIEAYYQRIPLIVCTADRPQNLRNSGANQTINQQNIFVNHIRFFQDAGLPSIPKLGSVRKLAEKAFQISSTQDRGPIHLNFPFEKPFEPDSFTDIIDEDSIEKIFLGDSFEFAYKNEKSLNAKFYLNLFSKVRKGLILVGYNNYGKDFATLLAQLSNKYSYPIYIDGACGIRFGNHNKTSIVENFTALVRSEKFQKEFDPELIIQFGAAPTANVVLEFFKNSKAKKILINEFGDKNDPSLTANKIVKANPLSFCQHVLNSGLPNKINGSQWFDDLITMNKLVNNEKQKCIYDSNFPFEGKVSVDVINSIPSGSNLMVSNSLPIRDIDFFAPTLQKEINLYTNRGASGIDGINSTALGIAKASVEKTFLIIGDLAFYHDMNGLYTAIKFQIPLTIILINNSGGGIFESLPISEYKEHFKNNFLTPLHIDFQKFVQAYGGKFIKIKSWTHFKKELKLSCVSKKLTVLEIKTDARKSKSLRQQYWTLVSEKIDKHINEVINRRNSVSSSGRGKKSSL